MALQESNEEEASMIALFAPDGGMRLSFVAEVASELAKQGHHVLLMDANPLHKPAFLGGRPTLFEKLKPAFSGSVASVLPLTVDEVSVLNYDSGGKVYRIMGDHRLESYGSQLHVTTMEPEVSVLVLNGVFRHFAKRSAAQLNCSIILVEMGPGISAWNRTVLLSCDFQALFQFVWDTSFGATASDFPAPVFGNEVFVTHVLPEWDQWRKKVGDKQQDLFRRDPHFGQLIAGFNQETPAEVRLGPTFNPKTVAECILARLPLGLY